MAVADGSQVREMVGEDVVQAPKEVMEKIGGLENSQPSLGRLWSKRPRGRKYYVVCRLHTYFAIMILGPKCVVHLNFRGLTCAKAKIRDQKIKLISQGNGSSSVALVMPVQIIAQRTVHGTVVLSGFILCL